MDQEQQSPLDGDRSRRNVPKKSTSQAVGANNGLSPNNNFEDGNSNPGNDDNGSTLRQSMRSERVRKSVGVSKDGLNYGSSIRQTTTQEFEEDLSDCDEDLDVKRVEVDFKETKEILKLAKEYEAVFNSSKQEINVLDKLGIRSVVVVRVHRQSYSIIKENVYKTDPNFDTEMIGENIHNLKKSSQDALDQLSRLKGEYFCVNDTVINKDINTFKLDQIKKSKIKQTSILEKLPAVDTVVNREAAVVKSFTSTYHTWEVNLFKQLVDETEIIVGDTNTFMEEIDSKMDTMTQDILKIKQDLGEVAPQTKEQMHQLNRINVQVSHVEKVLELADEAMERNDQSKEKLTLIHEQCRLLVTQMKKLKLTEMIDQTRKIKMIIRNMNDWQDLYNQLKMLRENEIDPADFDVKKAQTEVGKYVSSVSGGRKDEYDDLIRKIQKSAKLIRDGGEEQKQRLDSFTLRYLEGAMAKVIADADLLFLSKEVLRYESSIISMQSTKDSYLEESTKIDVHLKQKQKQLGISTEDLHHLRFNLKSLDKQQNVDLPRIKVNVDTLEAFAVKAMKNRLNDDNRKSQTQISGMKKNYEDLQKLIDDLNVKVVKAKEEFTGVQAKLDTEDKEKDNDFQFKVLDKINECDKDINGHKSTETQTGPASLNARKKEIIASINKMVNQFNENNKMIKENNKAQKSEKEINDLINKNKQIQQECQEIEDKVEQGKIFAGQIDERLNLIFDPTLPELETKFEEKNGLIDQCDDLFDGQEEKIKAIDANLLEQLADINVALKKLQDQGPINNPQQAGNDTFVNAVVDLTNKGTEVQKTVEDIQVEMAHEKEKLMEIIQPLNDLGEREVKTPEVQLILEALQKCEIALKDAETDLGNTKAQIQDLKSEIDLLLDGEKCKKIEKADEALAELDIQLANLENTKKDCVRKLQKYNDMIADAKSNEGQQDPQLMNLLKRLEKEAGQIGDQLKDISIKEGDLKKKREDAKATIDDAYANPENYNPQQIDTVAENIGELNEKTKGHNDKVDKIDKDLDRRIEELSDLLSASSTTKALEKDINSNLAQMKEDLGNLRDLLSKLPGTINALVEILNQMKQGSLPDKSADYWEEREDIEKWLANLIKLQETLKDLQVNFDAKDKKYRDLSTAVKKTSDVPTLTSLLEEIKVEQAQIAGFLEDGYDVQDGVLNVQKEMDDCQIPVNIKMRANQIDQLREKLDNLHLEFSELRLADENYEGTTESERDIKLLIEKVERKLSQYDAEKDGYLKYQKSKMEAYTERQILSLENAIIVKEVRLFKEKIDGTFGKIGEIEDLLRQLNELLISQDLNNAAKLLEQQSAALRKRLQIAQVELNKIGTCGDEMDGNTSHNEEEEFIDALKEEMPEVFKNIEANFELLDTIDELIAEVKETKSIDTMQQLKNNINDAHVKVEQCEGLVNKLENEIIEWDAYKKLCRRDEELGEIETLLQEFRGEIGNENDIIRKGREKQQAVLASAKEEKVINDTNYLLEGVAQYEGELVALLNDVNGLDEDRNACFVEFDIDAPTSVKEERNKRNANQLNLHKLLPPSTASNKPEEMYYKLHINCKYRRRIHELLKSLRLINQKKRDLFDKWASLKSDLNVVPRAAKAYKAIKGDKIDEMWCECLNRANCGLACVRISSGKYLFGTRNIICKIVNGKLLVRVGGGYMSADEFVAQYAQIEILKMMKKSGDPDFEMARQSLAHTGNNARRSGSNPRASVNVKGIGMAEMKAKMMNDLNNAQTYEEPARMGNTGNQRASSPAGSAARKTRGAGSPKAGRPTLGK